MASRRSGPWRTNPGPDLRQSSGRLLPSRARQSPMCILAALGRPGGCAGRTGTHTIKRFAEGAAISSTAQEARSEGKRRFWSRSLGEVGGPLPEPGPRASGRGRMPFRCFLMPVMILRGAGRDVKGKQRSAISKQTAERIGVCGRLLCLAPRGRDAWGCSGLRNRLESRREAA